MSVSLEPKLTSMYQALVKVHHNHDLRRKCVRKFTQENKCMLLLFGI